MWNTAKQIDNEPNIAKTKILIFSHGNYVIIICFDMVVSLSNDMFAFERMFGHEY